MSTELNRIDSKIFIALLLGSLLISAFFIYHRIYVAQGYGFYTTEESIPDVTSELTELLNGTVK